MSSLYRGLAEILKPSPFNPPITITADTYQKVRLGQVLDIVLDETSDLYSTDFGIGAIRFRFYPDDAEKAESAIRTIAIPIDRSHFTVPLPGEQVLIYPIFVGTSIFYTYGQILQQDLNGTYNSSPFIVTQPGSINPNVLDALVDVNSLAKRFEDKLTIPIATYTGLASYYRSMREGDLVVESRFGSSILFTSTMEKNIIKTLFTDLTIGQDVLQNSFTTGDGDPVVIIQANKRTTLPTGKTQLVKPSINDDDSSVYLTTTQAIPIKIACSKTMYTWNVDLVKKEASTTLDPVTLLADFFPEKYNPDDVFTLNMTANFTANNQYSGPLDPSAFKGGNKESNIKMLIGILQQAGVSNRFAILGALGTIGKESGFIPKNEYGYGTTGNDRLRKLFGKRLSQFNDAQLDQLKVKNEEFYDYIYGYRANISWNTGNDQPGDGWKYRGRGFNQITFKALYRKYGELVGQDLVSNPDLLNDTATAGIAAVQFCLSGLKRLKIDPNSFTNLEDAVYYCVKVNAGGGREVRGSEDLLKAQKVADGLSTSGLI